MSSSSTSVLQVARLKSERHGEELYGYSHWPRGDCKFFLWKEYVNNMFIERSNGTSTAVTFQDLKIKNLELHNMLLIEENKNLKARTFYTETKSKKPYVLTLLIAIAILLYLSNSYLVTVVVFSICVHLYPLVLKWNFPLDI
ncbi:hypothetical protein Hanom_Chr05g00426831 [Helianthus anomalus]